MKMMKKVLAVVLALSVVMAFSITSFAATGNDGSITITNAQKEKSYSIYKVFDANVYTDEGETQGTVYTYEGTLPENNFFEQDSKTKVVTYKGEGTTLSADAIAFLAGLVENATPIETIKATGSTVTFDGLAYGYYYISTDSGTAVTIDSANKTAEVIDKNGTPSITKDVDAPTVTIGEERTFTLEVPLVQYKGTKGIDEYYIFDEMDNAMTIDVDSIEIKVGDQTLTKGTNYSVATTGLATGMDFRITLPIQNKNSEGKYDETYIYDANAKAVITYKAMLNEGIDGKVGTALVNTATLDYDYDTIPGEPQNPPEEPPTEPTPDDVKGELPSDSTENFSSEIKITKVDPEGNPLTGAVFSINAAENTVLNVKMINQEMYQVSEEGTWYALKDGTYTETAPTDKTKDSYVDGKTKYKVITEVKLDSNKEVFSPQAQVGSDGIITFTGLGVGTYTITELVAPSGYNLLQEPIEVTVGFGDDGFTCNVEGATVSDGVISFNVVNNAGPELPSTGGIGTTIFYVLGALLVLGAAVMLITRRRMAAK